MNINDIKVEGDLDLIQQIDITTLVNDIFQICVTLATKSFDYHYEGSAGNLTIEFDENGQYQRMTLPEMGHGFQFVADVNGGDDFNLILWKTPQNADFQYARFGSFKNVS